MFRGQSDVLRESSILELSTLEYEKHKVYLCVIQRPRACSEATAVTFAASFASTEACAA